VTSHDVEQALAADSPVRGPLSVVEWRSVMRNVNTGENAVMVIGRSCTCMILILSIFSAAPAKEWRGIVPLHSTRAEVEKLFGPPRDPRDDLDGILVSYHLPDVILDIQYAANPGCAEEWPYDSWNVPKGTVTL
jgi:hypothetical protein